MNIHNPLRIALFSWFLPPSREIMARRWGKLVPEMQKSGAEIHLITTETKCDKFIYPNAFFYYLKQSIPESLVYGSKNFTERFTGFFWRILISLFSKGSKYDRALFMRCKIHRIVRKLLRNNVNIIIATGSPNHLLYLLALEREKQNFKFVVDLRDPWTWGNQFDCSNNSTRRKKYEKYKLEYVVKMADLFFVPSLAMLQVLTHKFPDQKNKFVHLPHGIDPLLVKEKIAPQMPVKNGKRLIYGGTFYSNSRESLLQFDRILSENSEVNCVYDIYTHETIIKSYVNTLKSSSIKLNSFLSEEELVNEIICSDYYLAFYPNEYKDFLSAKIFEVISLNIPFILVSESGLLSDFITSNNLGIHILPQDFEKRIMEILNSDVIQVPKINLERYYFSNISRDVLSSIKEL